MYQLTLDVRYNENQFKDIHTWLKRTLIVNFEWKDKYTLANISEQELQLQFSVCERSLDFRSGA
jgi:hypothetical protein